MDNQNINWTTPDGDHDGGTSYGVGFCISWQRGPTLDAGRNGAFLLEVLEACRAQIRYFQDSKFACPENEQALNYIGQAMDCLDSRRAKRKEDGKLGTTQI